MFSMIAFQTVSFSDTTRGSGRNALPLRTGSYIVFPGFHESKHCKPSNLGIVATVYGTKSSIKGMVRVKGVFKIVSELFYRPQSNNSSC